MTRFKSPVESAYHDAVRNRLHSIIFSALNNGVPPKERKRFREHWLDQGPIYLIQLLARCAAQDWSADPDGFWVDPWFAKYLRPETDGIYYCLYQWLDDIPLPPNISEDPHEEDRKVRELARLYSALNPDRAP